MTDRRITPDPARATLSEAAQVAVSFTDLCKTPEGRRERQVIFGDAVTVLHRDAGWCYVQSGKDGYCGFVQADALGPPSLPTHRVSNPSTHAYSAADLKSPDRIALSFASRVTVLATDDAFAQTNAGFIPLGHLVPVAQHDDDPAEVATKFLGTPYLWGGNSRWGIDCSGLVQAALLACGIPCPGDSDMQMTLGHAATGGYRRNDLIFWKGHVAIVSDPQTIIHSNGGSMSTNYEGIAAAIKRIADNGDGPVTAHRRL
jgi:cell wall-associated NlpC family hydrolase